MQHPNFFSAFRKVAFRKPNAPAIVAPDLALSYDKLRQIADAFALKMQEHGVEQGHLVVIDTTDTVVSIASVLAISALGAEYAPFEQTFRETATVRPDHVFRTPERLGFDDGPAVKIGPDWSPKSADFTDNPDREFPGFSGGHQPCWLMHSSGTTGSPKFMRMSAELVSLRINAVQEDFVSDLTNLAILFPCTARPYTIRAIALLLSGGCLVDSIEPNFLHLHGVNLVCASPRHLEMWLGASALSPRIARVQFSGSRVNDALVEKAFRSFDQVEDVYGSSETIKAHIVAARRREGGDAVWFTIPQAGTLQIVDEAGREVPVCEDGEVRIQNPYMIDGYLNAPEDNARSFRDGWFYPGDRARMGMDGRLDILGRNDSVINLGGIKVDLEAVDAALSSARGITGGCVFRSVDDTQENALDACVLPEQEAPEGAAVEAAHAACLDQFGPAVAPRRIFVVTVLPLTPDGVVRREECRRRAALALKQGELS